ncbi:hypothetical protein [Yoonia sp. 2307UL14-13]|uniref:hypothetical protein n=1 Tax=Yoonia sp. 2307UL14-13 TaxID=3126506 RepID=UPI00309C91EA
MTLLKISRLIYILSPFFISTVAVGEPITLRYFARVQLQMVDPTHADFDCDGNDLTAQIVIDEDTFGVASVDFPISLLSRPKPPQITLRRGTERVLERPDRTPTRIDSTDWDMTIAGGVGLCVGPATLQVVQGNFAVFTQLGQYEGVILDTDDVLQDSQIEYLANIWGEDLVHLVNSGHENSPPEMSGKFIGPIVGDNENRVLGRLDFNTAQSEITFKGSRDLGDVTHPTRLNIRLILEEAGPASD